MAAHQVVERGDFEGDVERPLGLRGIKHDAVVHLVEGEIGDFADIIGRLGAERAPETQVLGRLFRAHADAEQTRDAGVAGAEETAGAPFGAQDDLDEVSAAVAREDRALDAALFAFAGVRSPNRKAGFLQSGFERLQRGLIPRLDRDAGFDIAGKGRRAGPIVRTRSSFAIRGRTLCKPTISSPKRALATGSFTANLT